MKQYRGFKFSCQVNELKQTCNAFGESSKL